MSNQEITVEGTAYSTQQLHESEQGWYMFNAAWKTWRAMFLNLQGESLLDLGCGSGIGMSFVKVFKPDIRITGVEVDMAHKSVWDTRNLNVVKGNIYNLKFDDNSFDTVWSSHVLEHLVNPETMIAESFRIARKRIIHAVPVGNVEDKNLGTKHLQIYNRINFKNLFGERAEEVRVEYVEDPYMSSFVAILEK